MSALTNYVTISSHHSYQPGMFAAFNRSLDNPKDDAKKQDGRARQESCCPFETIFDDNLCDVIAHLHMVHGDVHSDKLGPGVNIFAPEGQRKFWVSAKSLPFG